MSKAKIFGMFLAVVAGACIAMLGIFAWGILFLIVAVITITCLPLAAFLRYSGKASWIHASSAWLYTILGGLSCLIAVKTCNYYRFEKAVRLVNCIKAFQKESGRYPDSLSEATSENSMAFIYKVDSSRSAFSLSYSVDGWSRYTFSSGNSRWHIEDWQLT